MTKNTESDPVAEAQARQAEIVAEQEAAQSVQPTPTQEEADKAKLGVLDGDFVAPEDATGDDEAPKAKAETAGKPGTYKTRSSSAG